VSDIRTLLDAVAEFQRVYGTSTRAASQFGDAFWNLQEAIAAIEGSLPLSPGKKEAFNMAGQEPQGKPESPSKVQKSTSKVTQIGSRKAS